MESRVFLGLGSNVGDSRKYLSDAIAKIGDNENINIQKVSSLYSTKPWGGIKQNDFLNAVISIKTKLDAFEILKTLKSIERVVGRKKSVKWGPREIDIDILLFGDQKIESNLITIPHKELLNRDFFYIPILEIDPFAELPGGERLSELISDQNKNYIIDKFEFKI